ncbi:hypothetical protein VNO78_24756 [Psophocarpus tetragonolobus]|uniref:Uncharacterized protein n=1 Tax=Psophocarpus tetragonolobus TaxID=3891 RepID=A0AAN9S6L3_PSOTE
MVGNSQGNALLAEMEVIRSYSCKAITLTSHKDIKALLDRDSVLVAAEASSNLYTYSCYVSDFPFNLVFRSGMCLNSRSVPFLFP